MRMFEFLLPRQMRFRRMLADARAADDRSERAVIDELIGQGISEAFAYHIVRPMFDISRKRHDEIEAIGPSFMA